MGQKYLGPCVIEMLEKVGYYVQVMDLSTIVSKNDQTPEFYIATLFHELKRQKKAALCINEIERILTVLPETTLGTLFTFLNRDREEPLILIATSNEPLEELSADARSLFEKTTGSAALRNADCRSILILEDLTEDSRRGFFENVLNDIPKSLSELKNCNVQAKPREKRDLPLAPPENEFMDVFQEDLGDLEKEVERHRLAVRQHLSMILDDLKKGYRIFARPVDRIANPEYIPEKPMDLGTMEDKVLKNCYATVEDFMADINLIVRNVEEFNDPRIPYQKENILKGLKMRDAAQEHILLLPRDFAQSCWLFKLLNKEKQPETIEEPQSPPDQGNLAWAIYLHWPS